MQIFFSFSFFDSEKDGAKKKKWEWTKPNNESREKKKEEKIHHDPKAKEAKKKQSLDICSWLCYEYIYCCIVLNALCEPPKTYWIFSFISSFSPIPFSVCLSVAGISFRCIHYTVCTLSRERTAHQQQTKHKRCKLACKWKWYIQ